MHTCVDIELHPHLLRLHASGDMENYRERTLVASISSLVSKKCDIKREDKRRRIILDNCKQEKVVSWGGVAHRNGKVYHIGFNEGMTL